jgi:ATP-dependent RNA helicase RhlE
VINFDMPDTVDAYTHRIGRTGRAHKTGTAYTFATSEDRSMLQSIEKVLGLPIEKRSLPGFDYGNFIPENQFPRKTRAASKKTKVRV